MITIITIITMTTTITTTTTISILETWQLIKPVQTPFPMAGRRNVAYDLWPQLCRTKISKVSFNSICCGILSMEFLYLLLFHKNAFLF